MGYVAHVTDCERSTDAYIHTRAHDSTLWICVGYIQTAHSITDELLPARDKSPPVCGISVVVHVGARPDPTASALSPTT